MLCSCCSRSAPAVLLWCSCGAFRSNERRGKRSRRRGERNMRLHRAGDLHLGSAMYDRAARGVAPAMVDCAGQQSFSLRNGKRAAHELRAASGRAQLRHLACGQMFGIVGRLRVRYSPEGLLSRSGIDAQRYGEPQLRVRRAASLAVPAESC
eukprot:6964102-Prymnesium_polylepis.4